MREESTTPTASCNDALECHERVGNTDEQRKKKKGKRNHTTCKVVSTIKTEEKEGNKVDVDEGRICNVIVAQHTKCNA